LGAATVQELITLKDYSEKQIELPKEVATAPMTIQKLRAKVDKALGIAKPAKALDV